MGGVFYGSQTARGPSRNCSCRMGNELELCKVLCLLGEQHVVSGGVIAVEAVVNACCGCVCWLDDGWWADCMADAK